MEVDFEKVLKFYLNPTQHAVGKVRAVKFHSNRTEGFARGLVLQCSETFFEPFKSSPQHVHWDLNKTSKTLTETITALFLMV